MAQLTAERGLRRVLDVLDAGAGSPPLQGRLAAPVLHALAALVPCDAVVFADLEPGTATDHVRDACEGGVVTYLREPETEPAHAFWRHYAGSDFCNYPTRTGDDRSVTSRSDFYSTREWLQTPMYVDVMAEYDAVFELMCALPAAPGRSRRLLFFRSGSCDFTDEDRLALALLRPHLAEMVGRRRDPVPTMPLTQRQTELLQLVADGRTNEEIARALHLSPHTVRAHLSNVFERLGVTTRAAAVAKAFSA